MNEGYGWWLILVGIGIGVAAAWLFAIRLPARDDDLTPEGRQAEAEWISRVVVERGGFVPALLVHEVLDLHDVYLRGDAVMSSGAPSPGDLAPMTGQPGPHEPVRGPGSGGRPAR